MQFIYFWRNEARRQINNLAPMTCAISKRLSVASPTPADGFRTSDLGGKNMPFFAGNLF